MMKIFSNAVVVEDVRNLSREEWLELRRDGVGGSDASAILGLNPYSSPLRTYLDKIGEVDEPETNEAMRQGVDLEQYVAERFTEQTGKKVKRLNKMLKHKDLPWMLANIDRQIVGENAGLECKTTSAYSKFKFDEGEINPHYYWQSMHYMAMTGADKWYVAILVLGRSFHVFEIARDDEAIATLIGAEQTFWEEHVMKKIPPLPTGSEADGNALTEMYPQADEGEDAIEFSSDIDSLLDLRAIKVSERDAIQVDIDEIDQQIKAELGKHERGESARWTVTWKNTTTSRVDSKALRQKYPAIAEEMTKVTASRRFMVKRVEEEC